MSTQNIATALIKFQKEVPAITFNAAVKYSGREFKYADLACILNTVRPILNKVNIALVQGINIKTCLNTDRPIGVVTTKLLHDSGESVESETFYNLSGTAQEQGAAITYARRYALAAILGIAAEEDDDNSGSKPTPLSKSSPTTNPYNKPTPLPAPAKPIGQIQDSMTAIKNIIPTAAAPIAKPAAGKPSDLGTFIEAVRMYDDLDALLEDYQNFIDTHKLSEKQRAWLDKELESKQAELLA